MALPTAGPIKLSQVKDEFNGPDHKLSSYYRGRNNVTANNTNVPTSGLISMGNLRGAARAVPGSRALTTPGTHQFTVPAFTTLTIELWGGGGGGQGIIGNFSGASVQTGTAGGASTVQSLALSAGGGGATGSGGNASGGDINTNGGRNSGLNPGYAPNSTGVPGKGGASRSHTWEQYESPRTTTGAGGGGGAYVKKTFTPAQLAAGSSLALVVGAGGTGGIGSAGAGGSGAGPGENGERGEIRITWS